MYAKIEKILTALNLDIIKEVVLFQQQLKDVLMLF